MARGSLAGIVSGVLVSGLGLGVASLSLPPVEIGGMPAVEQTAAGAEAALPDTAPAGEPEVAPDESVAPEAAGAQAPEMAETPAPEAAEADAGEAAQGPDGAPDAAAPAETGEPGAADAPEAEPEAEPLTGDETGADPGSVPEGEGEGDAASGAAPEEAAPRRGEAAETEITAQPNGTPLPPKDQSPEMETAPVKVPMADAEAGTAIAGMETAEKLPPALPPAREPAPEAETPEAPAAEDLTAAPAAEPEPAPAPEPEPKTEPAPEPAPEIAPEIAPEEPRAEPEPAAEIPTIVAEPAPGGGAAAPEPAPAEQPEPEPAPRGADAVVTGRLPTIGDDTRVVEEPTDPVKLPAIVRNAIDFADAGDKPRLALLLLDTGNRDQLADIGKLPFPLTVAVDAGAEDAAEAIAFYKSKGIEVALLLPLPAGAAPADVDQTVQVYGPLLEDVASVVTEPDLGFQALGPGAVQLATNLSESGHGLVSFPSGLNTGYKAALKQGVPAGLVFLDLDGEGQGGPVIRRFLDNAAFRARNEDGVIVLARTRPETLQALLDWSLGNRAQTVTLAPISAVLLAGAK